MKGGSRAQGFTIVETLIAMAVSAALLVSAMAVINGRQNKTQFAQAARDAESQVQAIINEVSSGFFPSSETFRCTPSGGGPVLATLVSGTQEQGTNAGCIFLGKIVHMSIDAPDSARFNVYSVVGLRENAAGPVVTLADSRPRVLARSDVDAPTVPDVFDAKTIAFSPPVVSLRYNNTTNIGAFGFLSRPGAAAGASDTTERVDLVAVPGTALGRTKGLGAQQINAGLSGAIINPTAGVQLCIRSNGGNQSALITVGGQGRPLAVSTQIRNSADCS